MEDMLNVAEAKTRLIQELSEITGFKYLKSGVLKKTVKDIVFEINFFSSKWNESGQSIEINAELRLIYKTYGKLPVDNVVASMSYQPENGYWYDISTESRLLETRNILEKRFQETAMDLVHRFENNYHSAVQYLFFEGFEKYDVHLDFIAEHLGQEAIKDKAHQIYVGLSDEVKEQIVQYQNGARNKTWMLKKKLIQHTYDVQTFDDGNKIIRPALSNEYEALLGCLIDFPDLMERSVDIVIDGEAEIYNTAGNVFSADIEKEITVITCYLVDDYEPLCVSTEDLKKLLYEWNNILRFKKSHSKLYDILLAELEAGNTIRETYRGRFSDSDETTFIFLNKTLKTKVRTDIPGITYMEVNDPHYWNAEYDDKENRLCLAW